jgi:signal transduction histidine kinase/ligand-binding sensor domain-containing protein
MLELSPLFSRFGGGVRASRWVGVALVLAHAGLVATPSDPEYQIRTWTTDDGLPHNSTTRMVQDHAGFLWFATVGGLARFDGRQFREFQPPPAQQPRGLNIRGLAEERPGTLLLLPTSREVVRFAEGAWTIHPVTSALNERHEIPDDLHVDANGTLWVATARGGLVRWSADKKIRFFDNPAGPATRARRYSFATDAAGKSWIASDSLLAWDHEGELENYEHTPPEPILIASGHDGRTWVCTDHSLQRLDHGRLVLESEAVPWSGEFTAVRGAFEDSRGTLWIASYRRGLFCYSGGRFRTIPVPFSTVASVSEDREGNIWLTTDGGGVVQLREKAYRLYNAAAGLASDIVSSVAEDASGRMWLADRTGGLACVEQDGSLRAGDELSRPPIYSNAVCIDARNRVWFGGGQSGLFRWQPGTSEAPILLPAPRVDLHVLFLARNGDVWFAADPDTVGFYREDQLHLFSSVDGFRRNIRCIAEDHAGCIWLGTSAGELLCWDGNRCEVFDATRGFPPQPVHVIHADSDNRLWIGTAGGLVLKDGEQFHRLTQAQGLTDDIIMQIVEDDEARLWFAGRRGLFYVAKSDLLAAARSGSEAITSHVFGRNQGLVGLNPTPNYQPAAVKGRDGRLWFATSQGAVVVEPAKLPKNLPSPPVLVDEVLLDGRTLPSTVPLRIPSGRHRVEFRLAALSYTAPEQVLLRHRLEGVDQPWIETGSDRMASYTNLSPGDYLLHVMARNSTGRWNTEGATLALTVVPAWWETAGFRVSGLLLLTALTAWLARTIAQHRLRQRLRRLEQEHALEKERVRIARDLHDDLGASLTELGLMAERLVGTPAPELSPQLAGLARRTQRLSTELSGIVWTMSPRNGTLDRLAEFIRLYAQRVLRGTPIDCNVKGGEAWPALPLAPDLQHQIVAATKEALNNVLKHSGATEAVIELRYTGGFFEIYIRDNGRGFLLVAAEAADGNGLRNIRARIKEIGGEVSIASTLGCGTQVTLRVALPGSAPSR